MFNFVDNGFEMIQLNCQKIGFRFKVNVYLVNYGAEMVFYQRNHQRVCVFHFSD